MTTTSGSAPRSDAREPSVEALSTTVTAPTPSARSDATHAARASPASWFTTTADTPALPGPSSRGDPTGGAAPGAGVAARAAGTGVVGRATRDQMWRTKR